MFKKLSSRLNILHYEISLLAIKFVIGGVIGIAHNLLKQDEVDFIMAILTDEELFYLGRVWSSQGILKSRLNTLAKTDFYKAHERKVKDRVYALAKRYNIKDFKF